MKRVQFEGHYVSANNLRRVDVDTTPRRYHLDLWKRTSTEVCWGFVRTVSVVNLEQAHIDAARWVETK